MNPTDTLTGNYGTATLTLSDGTQMPVLVRKILRSDNTYGIIVVDDAVIEFEKRFQGTKTVPNDYIKSDTSVLVEKEKKEDDEEKSTRIRLCAGDMIMFLGDPDRIIAQGGFDEDKLKHLKEHKVSSTMARRICMNIGGIWAKVAKFIPTHFPDRK
jgi:hypothetical protein